MYFVCTIRNCIIVDMKTRGRDNNNKKGLTAARSNKKNKRKHKYCLQNKKTINMDEYNTLGHTHGRKVGVC